MYYFIIHVQDLNGNKNIGFDLKKQRFVQMFEINFKNEESIPRKYG